MINKNLHDPFLKTMNFLNDSSVKNPDIISFASGDPEQKFFNVKDIINCFLEKAEIESNGNKAENILNEIGQYNKTNGIINDTISKLLLNDENIQANPEDIIITSGAQEGMVIIINTFYEPGSKNDVILVSDPSYIGFIGYAKIYGIEIVPVKQDEDGINLENLETIIKNIRKSGKNPKILYEVFDFQNPTGSYMSFEKRKKLIELSEKFNFYIVEDNPYGYYRYDVEKIPTLKSIDKYKRVIYLGTFSKTICPGLRIGYMVADQVIRNKNESFKIVDEYIKSKSYISLNTSNINQAMVESVISQNGYTLMSYCQPRIDSCKKNRDKVIKALEKYFPSNEKWAKDISWNKPKGGFFLTMDIPFKMTDKLLSECIKEYRVMFCPMSFFHLDPERKRKKIRIAFSNRSIYNIKEGIERLSKFLREKMK